MTAHTITRPGAPVWLDLSSSDVPGAIRFYGDLFGWEADIGGPALGGYVTFSRNGARVAGLLGAHAGGPEAWTTYLLTNDADKTAEAAIVNGGHVRFNDRVADLGSMLVITDTTGAQVGGWQPAAHTGFEITREHGTAVWFELHTNHYRSAITFYERVFGWSVSTLSDSDQFREVTLGAGDEAVAGIYDATLAEGQLSRWHVYFAVDDADAAAAKLVELGGTQLEPIMDTEYGRMLEAHDPTGVRFTMTQLPA